MGQVFGVNGVKEPPFSVVWQSNPYEIRLYQPYFIAEVPMNGGRADNEAFMQLARYIGVFGTPQNQKRKLLLLNCEILSVLTELKLLEQGLAMTAPVITAPAEKMAMTAPVITVPAEKIAMTAPVFTSPSYMQFVLPFEYKTLEEIPTPTNKAISIKSIPSKLVAVHKFTWNYSEQFFKSKLNELNQKLMEEQLIAMHSKNTAEETTGITASEVSVPANIPWSFAQYNPPFTLPFLRRNEVWMDLTDNSVQSTKLQELLLQHQQTSSQ
jgi:hypothetical protein